jgi:hypothetical protein
MAGYRCRAASSNSSHTLGWKRAYYQFAALQMLRIAPWSSIAFERGIIQVGFIEPSAGNDRSIETSGLQLRPPKVGLRKIGLLHAYRDQSPLDKFGTSAQGFTKACFLGLHLHKRGSLQVDLVSAASQQGGKAEGSHASERRTQSRLHSDSSGKIDPVERET